MENLENEMIHNSETLVKLVGDAVQEMKKSESDSANLPMGLKAVRASSELGREFLAKKDGNVYTAVTIDDEEILVVNR